MIVEPGRASGPFPLARAVAVAAGMIWVMAVEWAGGQPVRTVGRSFAMQDLDFLSAEAIADREFIDAPSIAARVADAARDYECLHGEVAAECVP